PEDDARTLGGQMRLQDPPAALVRAVLAPHRVEDGRLRARGVPLEKREHPPRFGGGEPQAFPCEEPREGAVVRARERKNGGASGLLQRVPPKRVQIFG